MELHTSIPMSQYVFDTLETNGHHLPVMTGSYLPMTFYFKFLKGKPLALGICIIVVSLIQIVLGIQSFFNIQISPFSIFTGIMCWAPVFYIITGSLMIAGNNKPSICLVNSSMVLNIINSFISLIGIILAVLDIYIVTASCHHFRTELRCIGFAWQASKV
ncbi:membrane-spanning 4-domains subfamily A member 18-like isoform X2 [Hyla sarda]|uniref:membrane-spanning 4-domains subfamily A member 18-like isoform X2 n=1 Tax=Hyla sarda TaxID=327740 RepID=UPI0024C31D1D|nr:membrane-spanning 4-domains subfamily A member 18-like isoform X2 [Hyla sarda]